MTDAKGPSRRAFLGRSALLGGALGLPAELAHAREDQPPAKAGSEPPRPNLTAEIEAPPPLPPMTFKRSGADFMVDVLKTLDIKYVAANPGSSFRGLQESIVNYGGNAMPEFLTCCHEESSVAMAHGYYKIAGKPMMAMVHGAVGVQHASMAIYNAYADRVPILMITAVSADANTRRPGIEWQHSVQDGAAMVRDITKWDDAPASLQHFAESQVRALKIALAQPMGPVLITADADQQEEELGPSHQATLSIPKLTLDHQPEGESGAVEEAADLLITAEHPVIVADRYRRTPDGFQLLVRLAELLQAPVIDTGDRCNFPSHHPLNLSDDRSTLLSDADVVLGLEVADLWSLSHVQRDVPGKPWKATGRPGAKIITIGTAGLVVKSNFQDFQRYAQADLSIVGDAEVTLPALIAALEKRVDASSRSAFQQRGAKFADRTRQLALQRQARIENVWDLSPVSSERLIMELYEQIKNDDWSLVGYPNRIANRIMPMDRYYRHTGGGGAAGIGYGAPAAVGSALANRDAGRLSVTIQPDGDLMYAPGVLWTAAHHRIPLLFVMFNNRAYHQELMHLQRIENRLERGLTNFGVGTTLTNPNIDYAKLAGSMGLYAEGPISDPSKLHDALKRALAVVRKGEPALLDVVTQPR